MATKPIRIHPPLSHPTQRTFSETVRLSWLIQDDAWLAHRENGYYAGEFDHGGPALIFDIGPFSTPRQAIDAAIRRSRSLQEAHYGN